MDQDQDNQDIEESLNSEEEENDQYNFAMLGQQSLWDVENQDIQEILNLQLDFNYIMKLNYPPVWQGSFGVKDSEEQEKYGLLNNIFDTLSVIEYDIVNKKMDIGVLNKRIKNAISLIEQLEWQMPTCILIKFMQVSQLLQQLNHPVEDDCIIEYQQFVKKYEQDYNKLNLLQNTENDEIFKAFIYDYEDLKYVQLSPNEKYLLVGQSGQVYLYDISTKLNRKIYNGQTDQGLFSQNSKQIVLQATKRIIIININTNKNLQLKKNDISKINCFMNKNYLHLICSKQGSKRIIKIDLKSNRQIFSLNIHMHMQKDDYIKYTSFLDSLIILQSYNYFKIFNEKTRKFTLTLKLQQQWYDQLFLINNNEMLSKDNYSQLIIWNIDYKNECLIKNRILQFYANNLYRGQPSFGYFYLVNNDKLQIIDENYNCIFQSDNIDYNINFNIISSIHQLNSDRIFLVFQKDGIYILKRHQQG